MSERTPHPPDDVPEDPSADVPDVPSPDVPDVPDEPEPDVPDVPDEQASPGATTRPSGAAPTGPTSPSSERPGAGAPPPPGFAPPGGYPPPGGYAPQHGHPQPAASPPTGAASGASAESGASSPPSGRPGSSGPPPPPPPPPPGYAPPGGYPPPGQPGPSAGWGAPPPPPPPPVTQPASVGDSFGWGWNKFVANLGPIIVTVLVYLVVATLISLLWNVVLGTANLGVNRMDRYGTWTGLGAVGAIGAFLGSALLTVVVLFVTYVLEAAITRGALVISYGQRLELRTMFQFPNLGAVLLAALLVSVLTSIGSLVCGVGALVVGYFVQFTLFFVIDKAQNAIDGLRSSFQLVTKNAATVLLFSVAAIVAVVIGALLCGIGLVVAIPVVILAQTYLYRRLLGEPVAP